MLIINEVKEAKKIIETNKFDKLSSAVSLLIRYYIQVDGLNATQTEEKIISFLKLNHEDFDNWEKSFKKIIKNANKFPLCSIDEIPITQKEIDTIFIAGTEKKEKILFTLLVLGKLKYLKSGKAWVDNSSAELFKIANAETNEITRDYIIKEFYDTGLVSYAQSYMNTSLHVNFIDDKGDAVFTVKDLRCLGFRWLKFKGRRYVECRECGKLFKPNSSNAAYCKEHRGYIPLKTKIVECIDCNTSFEAPSSIRSKRCPLCQRLHYNERKRKKIIKNADLIYSKSDFNKLYN